MNEATIVKDYAFMGDNQLTGRATSVHTKMTVNGNKFPAPPVAMNLFGETIELFRAKVTDAENGDRLKAAEKNAVGDTLRGMLSQLDKYVTQVGNGDPAIYLAAGFAVKMGPTPNGDLDPIESIKVILGSKSGTVKMSCTPVNNAVGYSFQYTLVTDNEADIVWQTKFNTKTKMEIEDLQAGKQYYFRMIAHGTNDRESYSETVKKIVA